MSTKIYYIIPEDGDDEAHPNVFIVPLPQNQVKVKDVKKSFPLKQHHYHFRFKRQLQNKFIWLDVVDDFATPPNYEGLFFCKVVRVEQALGNESFKPSVQPTTQTNESNSSKKKSTEKPLVSNNDKNDSLFEWTDMDDAQPQMPSSMPTSAKSSTNNNNANDLLDFLGSMPVNNQTPTSNMDFNWDSDPFQSAAPMFTAAPSANVPIPPRSVSPPLPHQPSNSTVAKKTSQSSLPTELGVEAAKQFKL